MSLEDTNVLWKEYTIALQCVRLYFHINLAPIALQLLWTYKSYYYVSYRNTGIYHDLRANFNNFFSTKTFCFREVEQTYGKHKGGIHMLVVGY